MLAEKDYFGTLRDTDDSKEFSDLEEEIFEEMISQSPLSFDLDETEIIPEDFYVGNELSFTNIFINCVKLAQTLEFHTTLCRRCRYKIWSERIKCKQCVETEFADVYEAIGVSPPNQGTFEYLCHHLMSVSTETPDIDLMKEELDNIKRQCEEVYNSILKEGFGNNNYKRNAF